MSRYATIRVDATTRAVELQGESLVDLGFPTLKEFFEFLDHGQSEGGAPDDGVGTSRPLASADFATVVPDPSKILCVGQNYRSHIEEMGREVPQFPTVFAKFADTLVGPYDEVRAPKESEAIDWEAELVIVIGKAVRHATETEAIEAIAGFTIMNDISERDWQFRTQEWLQGKIWEATTPVGPWVVTTDELPGGARPTLEVSLTVDGVEKQHANTSDLVFDPVECVRYLSTIITLRPGDIIATGTTGGVGHARKPPEYLQGGEEVVVSIEGLGELTNTIVRV